MAKNIIKSSANMIATPPSGNKGGPGTYNGEPKGVVGSHTRTKSPNAVPEKIYDGSVPKGKGSPVLPDKLPKKDIL
jgi:hypothetical protein